MFVENLIDTPEEKIQLDNQIRSLYQPCGYPRNVMFIMFKVIKREIYTLARMLPTFDLGSSPLFSSKSLTKYVVYYESIKRELKTEPIYECRCDERLKSFLVYFTL